MKKDVLKKLYREEKTGYRPGIKNKIFFLFFLCCSTAFAQINLKGFGKAKFFSTPRGNISVYSYDYSEDGINDIVLFGADKKQVIIHPSELSIYKHSPLKKFFFYPIDKMTIFNMYGNKQTHLFISRREMKIGLVTFTKYGTINLLDEINFDSFPSELIAQKRTNENNSKAIVYGPAFRGINIISQNGLNLNSNKIIKKSAFSYGRFVDLNYDGIDELVAVDILQDKIRFFNDLGNEIFYSNELMKNLKNITQIEIDDFNQDKFSDLIVSTEDGMNIFWGDSISSFSESSFYKSFNNQSKFVVADVNKDSNKDILFYDKSNMLSVCFFIEGKIFQEINLHKFNSPVDIIKSLDKEGESFVVLDSSGTMLKVGTLNLNDPQFSLLLSIQPISLFVGDFFDKKSDDFFILDKYNNRLNSIITDNELSNSYLYTETLPEQYSKMIEVNSGEKKIEFVLQNKSGKNFQLISSNLSNDRFKRKTYFLLDDIEAISSTIDSNLALISKSKGKSIFNNFTIGNLSEPIKKIELPFKYSNILVKDTSTIYFSEVDSENVFLNLAELSDGKLITKNIFSFQQKRKLQNPTIHLDKKENNLWMIFDYNYKTSLFTYELNTLNATISKLPFQLKNKDYSADWYNGEEGKYLFINIFSQKNLYVLKYDETNHNYLVVNVIESVISNSYFATPLFSNKFDYLTYVNELTNTLDFLRLND